MSFKDRKLFIPVPVNNVSSDICRQDAFCALYTDGISCRKQFRYRSQQNTPLGRGLPLQCFGSENTIQLGNFASMPFGHLRSGPSTVSCVPLRGTCLRRTPTHYSRSAHQCAGRAVYFAAAKYGKAGRPPGVATLVAVRGLVPQDKWLAGFRKFTLAGRMA